MVQTKRRSATAVRERPPNPYVPKECPKDVTGLCNILKEWGAEVEKWGKQVWKEIDGLEARMKRLEDAACDLERQVYYGIQINQGKVCNQQGRIPLPGGDPPTDSTQPPKPPFR